MNSGQGTIHCPAPSRPPHEAGAAQVTGPEPEPVERLDLEDQRREVRERHVGAAFLHQLLERRRAGQRRAGGERDRRGALRQGGRVQPARAGDIVVAMHGHSPGEARLDGVARIPERHGRSAVAGERRDLAAPRVGVEGERARLAIGTAQREHARLGLPARTDRRERRQRPRRPAVLHATSERAPHGVEHLRKTCRERVRRRRDRDGRRGRGRPHHTPCFRLAAMKSSRSPSSTACVLPTSWLVRRSLIRDWSST